VFAWAMAQANTASPVDQAQTTTAKLSS